MKHRIRGSLAHMWARRRLRALLATPVISLAMLIAAPPLNAAAQTTITCTLQIDNPHSSSHVPGTVNVVARWTCTAPVTSLEISVQLFLNGVEVASGANDNAGQAFLQANAATTCVPGEYSGTASGTVVFPPGFEPPSGGGSVASPTVLITCT